MFTEYIAICSVHMFELPWGNCVKFLSASLSEYFYEWRLEIIEDFAVLGHTGHTATLYKNIILCRQC